jgi:hypothetical protein
VNYLFYYDIQAGCWIKGPKITTALNGQLFTKKIKSIILPPSRL